MKRFGVCMGSCHASASRFLTLQLSCTFESCLSFCLVFGSRGASCVHTGAIPNGCNSCTCAIDKPRHKCPLSQWRVMQLQQTTFGRKHKKVYFDHVSQLIDMAEERLHRRNQEGEALQQPNFNSVLQRIGKEGAKL